MKTLNPGVAGLGQRVPGNAHYKNHGSQDRAVKGGAD
jgi:hypothetical protein